MKYLIDTDILIHHLMNNPKVVAKFHSTDYNEYLLETMLLLSTD